MKIKIITLLVAIIVCLGGCFSEDEDKYTLKVTVLDVLTNSPAANASVELSKRNYLSEKITDQNGEVEFHDLSDDSYKLYSRHASFGSSDDTIIVNSDESRVIYLK